MSTLKADLDAELAKLKTLRDELRVRAHLGSAELRDQLAVAETKLDRVLAELKLFEADAHEPLANVSEGIHGLFTDARDTWERLAARF